MDRRDFFKTASALWAATTLKGRVSPDILQPLPPRDSEVYEYADEGVTGDASVLACGKIDDGHRTISSGRGFRYLARTDKGRVRLYYSRTDQRFGSRTIMVSSLSPIGLAVVFADHPEYVEIGTYHITDDHTHDDGFFIMVQRYMPA
jgi:hypothetical protein